MYNVCESQNYVSIISVCFDNTRHNSVAGSAKDYEKSIKIKIQPATMDLTNLTVNETFDPDDTYPFEFKPTDVLHSINALLSASANCLILFIIAKYSIMRTRSNLYLANWCLCNFFVVILMPATLNVFEIVTEVSYEYACIWDETIHGVLFGNLLFVIILLFDWYLANHTRNTCANKFKQMHWFVIAITWIVIASISITSVTFCMLDWSYPLSLVCFLLGYLLIFIVIICIYILRCVSIEIFKKPTEKRKLELFLVTSYFVCWLPNWLLSYGQMFLNFYLGEVFQQVTYLLGYSHAWVTLIILYFCDKGFKLCLRRTFGAKDNKPDDTTGNKEQTTGLL